FKLLDYAPEPWTPLKSAALVKNMQWTLSRSDEDVGLERVLDSLGAGFFQRYYPARHPGSEPIFPEELFPVKDGNGNGGGLPPSSTGRPKTGAVASSPGRSFADEGLPAWLR